MEDAIKHLIMCFDDENGLPEPVYDATCEVIEKTLGEPAATIFGNYMDCTDGMFYIRRDSLWSMLNDMKCVCGATESLVSLALCPSCMCSRCSGDVECSTCPVIAGTEPDEQQPT